MHHVYCVYPPRKSTFPEKTVPLEIYKNTIKNFHTSIDISITPRPFFSVLRLRQFIGKYNSYVVHYVSVIAHSFCIGTFPVIHDTGRPSPKKTSQTSSYSTYIIRTGYTLVFTIVSTFNSAYMYLRKCL